MSEASLPLLLKQLALPTVGKEWETTAYQAQSEHWSYAKYLSVLAELEVGNRYRKKVQRYVKESKLPVGKTLSTFDFAGSASIHAPEIKALADNLDWVKTAVNLIFFGPSGVGKTHLAAAIGYRLIEQNVRVLFSTTTHLVQKLQLAHQECKLPHMLEKLSRIPVLILDDISYVKKNEAETHVLFELISQRYETNSLIITSNQPFSEWDQIFPDNMMAVAAVDRLVHHSTIINITEESYRRKHSKKSK